MNVQSYNAVAGALDSVADSRRRGLELKMIHDWRQGQRLDEEKERIRREIADRGKLKASLEEAAKDRDFQLQLLKMRLGAEMKARSGEAFWNAARSAGADNPGGMRGDLLGAEIDLARQRAAGIQRQNAAAASKPTTLADDLTQTDQWSTELFRAQQALQQAQAAGNPEAIFVAQGRVGRLQRLGEKYGSDKPKERIVKVKVPILGPTGEATGGFREWEEPWDENKHGAGAAGAAAGSQPGGITPLNSIELLRKKYGGQ